jgi:hypothetical protein
LWGGFVSMDAYFWGLVSGMAMGDWGGGISRFGYLLIGVFGFFFFPRAKRDRDRPGCSWWSQGRVCTGIVASR